MAAAAQRIRNDLDGVVYVQHRGKTLVLQAGDRIPAGVEVGNHLIATGKAEPDQPDGDEGDQGDEGTGDADKGAADAAKK